MRDTLPPGVYDARPIVDMFPSVETAAASLKTTDRTVYRWLRIGMTWQIADRVACQLGYHPVNVWPSWGRDIDLSQPARVSPQRRRRRA